MRAREETYRILEAALSVASEGVDEAEVALLGGDLGVTRFIDNQIQPASEQSTEAASLRVRQGGRVARIVTTDLSTHGIKEAAQHAKSLANHLPVRGVKQASFPDPQNYESIDAYDPEVEMLRAVERTALVGRAILAAHKAQLSASGAMAVRRGSLGLDGQRSPYALANTRGLLAYHPETRATFHVTMVSKRGVLGFAGFESASAADLDVEHLVAMARDRASLVGAQRTLDARPQRAVLEAGAVAGLLRFVARTCGATGVRSGASFLAGRIGQKITGVEVTIVDDYRNPFHRGVPFDIEGVARHRVPIIESGVARSPVYGWSSAVLEGKVPTGHRIVDPTLGEVEGAPYLVMSGGSQTLADLIGSTERGVLISRLHRAELVDPRSLRISGMTRGVAVIEDGEVVGPARDAPFDIELLSLLNHVEGLTAETWAEGLVVPAMKVSAFRLGSGE